MNKRIFVTSSVLVLLTLACNLTGTGSAPEPDPTEAAVIVAEPTQDSLPSQENISEESSPNDESAEAASEIPPRDEPNPVNVELFAETDNTTTIAATPEEGGELSVTGSDGVQYTLIIPPEALLSKINISMTPINSIGGIPLEGQLAGGVVFEPDGLVFLEPAELQITYPEGMDISMNYGFGTFTDGQDFHLKPSNAGENTISVPVQHFSSAGAVTFTGYNLNDVRNAFTPSSGAAWFENQLAIGIAPSESDEEFADLYEQALKQWFNDSIKPGLDEAAEDFERLDSIIAEVISWQKWQSVPPEPLTSEEFDQRFLGEYQKIWDGLARAFSNAFDTLEIYRMAGSPHRAVEMVRYYFLINNFTGDSSGSNLLWGNQGLDKENVRAQLSGCFRFDLDFRSKVEADFEGKVKFLAQVVAQEVDISWDIDNKRIYGASPLTYEIFKVEIEDSSATCSTSTVPGSADFDLLANFNVSRTVSRVTFLEVEIDFLVIPQEKWNCGRDLTTRLWHAHFAEVTDIVGSQQVIAVELDILDGTDPFARWTFNQETTLGGFEQSELTITHTPSE